MLPADRAVLRPTRVARGRMGWREVARSSHAAVVGPGVLRR